MKRKADLPIDPKKIKIKNAGCDDVIKVRPYEVINWVTVIWRCSVNGGREFHIMKRTDYNGVRDLDEVRFEIDCWPYLLLKINEESERLFVKKGRKARKPWKITEFLSGMVGGMIEEIKERK